MSPNEDEIKKEIENMTFTCHVCGKTRPNAKISVYHRDTSKEYGLPLGSAHQNIRYCNDSPFCREKAKEVDLMKNAAKLGDERMNVFVTTIPDCGSIYHFSIDSALGSIKDFLENSDGDARPTEVYTITMTKSEIDNMPEFGGC